MKKITVFLLSLLSLTAFGQTYFQDIGDADYKSLMKNGLTYIQSGDKVLDSMIEIGLENYWKVSPYKIIDADGTIKEDDVIMTLLEGTKLVIVSVKALKRSEISIYKTTAVADIDGFKSMVSEHMFHLLPYLINAFSDMAEKMNINKIEKRGLPYFNKMNELYLPSSKVLKDKTLLILTGAIQGPDVNKEELTKAGIKFEHVTFDQFREIESREAEDYCLLYLNSEMFSDITIFNVSDKSIAYTRHYIKNVPKLDKEDIKLIVSSWK